MLIKPGNYINILEQSSSFRWSRPKGEPVGVSETILRRHKDGSYSHVMRVAKGVEFKEPVVHDFFEEAFYVTGEMLNTKTKQRLSAGSYVFHKPGEKHGPFKCLKTCLILEFRYHR